MSRRDGRDRGMAIRRQHKAIHKAAGAHENAGTTAGASNDGDPLRFAPRQIRLVGDFRCSADNDCVGRRLPNAQYAGTADIVRKEQRFVQRHILSSRG